MASNKDLYSKAATYCASAERCKDDVRKKLDSWENETPADEIIDRLEQEGFIDEKRYASAYVRDKIRLQGWGKRKIRYSLQMKKVDTGAIDDALENAVPDEEYAAVLKKLMSAKHAKTKDSAWAKKMDKCKAFALARGFETQLVERCSKELEF